MAREISYMFKNIGEFVKLKAGVFSYLQRDIDKLLDTKDLDAEFMNFSQPAKSYNRSWIYLRAYYTWYEDENDDLGTYDTLKIAIPVGQNLFTRDPDVMDQLDREAGVYSVRDRFNNIDLVKVRILFIIYKVLKDIEHDTVPVSTIGKKWAIIEIADAGNLYWKLGDHAPEN